MGFKTFITDNLNNMVSVEPYISQMKEYHSVQHSTELQFLIHLLKIDNEIQVLVACSLY